MALYAVTIIFSDDTEARQRIRPQHREYLAQLLAQGKLQQSGPFADESGALLIYEAESEDEAAELLAADPYTDGGVFVESSIKEWNVVFSKYDS